MVVLVLWFIIGGSEGKDRDEEEEQQLHADRCVCLRVDISMLVICYASDVMEYD